MKRKRNKTIFPILLVVATLFMGIGYASINSVSLDINGLLSYKPQDGIFITDIEYLSGLDADDTNNKMTIDYQTLLNNKIVLSDTNKNSSISYKITVYNSTNDAYAFYDTLYSNDEFFYDNQDIIFTTSGINQWDEIESKESLTFTITFKYKDGLENINNNVLNSVINFKFSKYYNITYENIVNYNYPTRVFEGENLNVTFINDIPDFVEVSGTQSFNYKNSNLTITNITDNIVITSNILFKQETYAFNGTTDYINTNVYLFNEENINRDFEISFTISEYGDNVGFNTLINSMDESDGAYPGFVFRLQNNNNILRLYSVANSTGSSQNSFYNYETTNKIRILRLNNILYYQFNDGDYIQFLDFSQLNKTFDVPVTFGAGLDGNGNPWRYFKGTLSNMVIKFLDNPQNGNEINMYKHDEAYVFDGATDYVNTGIYLFNEENANKNFEISFTIDDDSENESYDTLVSIMDETGAPYYGITLRRWDEEYQLSANVSDTVSNTYYFAKANVEKIRLVKINNELYIIINDDNPVYIVDYSTFPDNLNVPVTFGASLDGNGDPWRYFKGTLSKLLVRYLMDDITIDDYVILYP